MSDDDQERRDPLEDAMRRAGLDPDQVRDWILGAGEWLKTNLADAVSAAAPAGEDVMRSDVPDPLDVPTDDQGAALAALDSGRWKVDPETSALTPEGDGPGPVDPLGVALDLRVRDWIDADGVLTMSGRHALGRWLEART